MEFLYSFLRRHFAVKPVVASGNVGFFSQAMAAVSGLQQVCVVWKSEGGGGGGGSGQ